MIENQVPKLLAQKFGGEGHINLKEVERETGLAYTTVSRWARNHVDRFDIPALNAWCSYFNVGVGDLLIYTPSGEK